MPSSSKRVREFPDLSRACTSKIHVSEFMEALSDPRAFLSQQEKRAEQLKAMGIDESDISTEGVIVGGNKINKAPGVPNLPGIPQKKKEEKEEVKFDSITPTTLKAEKKFVKVTKNQNKELDAMRKRHQKERGLVQKNQCSAIDKLVKAKGK